MELYVVQSDSLDYCVIIVFDCTPEQLRKTKMQTLMSQHDYECRSVKQWSNSHSNKNIYILMRAS